MAEPSEFSSALIPNESHDRAETARYLLVQILHSIFRSRHARILENAARRHQIEVLKRNTRHPGLR